MTLRIGVAAGLFLASGAGSIAGADEVTMEFGGTITYVDGILSDLGEIGIGDPWHLTYTADSAAPDKHPDDPCLGSYGLLDTRLVVGDHKVYMDRAGQEVWFGSGGQTLDVGATGYMSGPDLGGLPVDFALYFENHDYTAFPDDSQPLSPLDLSIFDSMDPMVLTDPSGGVLGPVDYWIARPGTLVLPPGGDPDGSLLGGSDEVGGIDYLFSGMSGGVLSAEYNTAAPGDVMAHPEDYPFGPINFALPTDPLMYWEIDFDGDFDSATITLGYDPSNFLGGWTEEDLIVWHYVGDEWLEVVPDDIDTLNHTLTFTTDSFSSFALGAIPEPTTLGLLMFGGLALLRRRRG